MNTSDQQFDDPEGDAHVECDDEDDSFYRFINGDEEEPEAEAGESGTEVIGLQHEADHTSPAPDMHMDYGSSPLGIVESTSQIEFGNEEMRHDRGYGVDLAESEGTGNSNLLENAIDHGRIEMPITSAVTSISYS